MAELAYREVYAMNAVEARKRLVRSYQELGSIRATAQLWHTSRQVVRKWVARYQAEGEVGRGDRSRRPQTSPRQTPPAWEQAVRQARQETGLGRRRLALYLQRHGISLSPYTIGCVPIAVWGWIINLPWRCCSAWDIRGMSGLRSSRRCYWTTSVPICFSTIVRRPVTIYWPITKMGTGPMHPTSQ